MINTYSALVVYRESYWKTEVRGTAVFWANSTAPIAKRFSEHFTTELMEAWREVEENRLAELEAQVFVRALGGQGL